MAVKKIVSETLEQQAAASCADSSARLRIRRGQLARTNREDAQAELERREPDELFEPLASRDAADLEP